MKARVLFWGFRSSIAMTYTVDIVRRSMMETTFSLQIEPEDKAISFVNFFSEETLRCFPFEFSSLETWIAGQETYSLAVLDVWSMLIAQDWERFFHALERFLKRDLPLPLLLLCPTMTGMRKKELNAGYSGSSSSVVREIFKKMRSFYDLILNSRARVILLETPPPLSLLEMVSSKYNVLCQENDDMEGYSRLSRSVRSLCALVSYRTSSFLSATPLAEALAETILFILQNAEKKTGSSFISFRKEVKGDWNGLHRLAHCSSIATKTNLLSSREISSLWKEFCREERPETIALLDFLVRAGMPRGINEIPLSNA